MLMNEKNIHVNIPKNGRVIDLGCGAATWVMDMATEMTTTTFVGVDVSPIFPTAIHPRNCSFLKENFLNGVSEPSGTFDVVFERSIAAGLTAELWQQTFQEAFRLLKPGGWLESVESDVTAQDAGPFTNMCFDHMLASMATRDVDTRIVRSLDRIMVSVGFVDVQVKEYCVPLGEWGGKLGQLWKQNLVSILQTVKPHLSRAGRITEGQVSEMIQSMCKETRDLRSYMIIYVTFGRKPL
ncbi:hypothetical protein BGZ58_010851 [Dissophora ornata]|nr:hypothetical protein BGZ58_010851 [Dissophora ornata]